MKSLLVHYKNVFPGGRVVATETSLDAYDADGNHRIALRTTGAGSLKDVGSEVGASDDHCLSPIPKNTRAYKLYKDGKVALSEEGAARLKMSAVLAVNGKVLSIEEYEKMEIQFDKEGNAITPEKAPGDLAAAVQGA